MAPFLSLVCTSSTLVSPNLGSGRPKEAPCFTEQLGMDLGWLYLGGGQKVVFVGKHGRVTSIVASVTPSFLKYGSVWEDFAQLGNAMNSEHHAL